MLPIPEQIDLGQLVGDVVNEYQFLADRGNVQIKEMVSNHIIVFVNRQMMKRVLSNVIKNAVQNTPNNGEVNIYMEGSSLCVLNTNAHIEEEQLPKLFDPFYRIDKARSRKDGHSGLGLTIAAKMLDAMKIAFSLGNVTEGVLFRMELILDKQE